VHARIAGNVGLPPEFPLLQPAGKKFPLKIDVFSGLSAGATGIPALPLEI
jgi:hypothetical protein